MKKTITLLLVAIIAISTVFASGKNESAASSGQGTGKLRVGLIPLGDETTASGRAQLLAQKTIAEAAGIELVPVQLGGYDDESFMTAYESMINQGVDAVLCFTLSETVLPLLKNLFEQNNVKFALFNRQVFDQKIKQDLFGSPMFIGNEHSEETQNAYDMVKWMHDTYSVKNMAVIGLTKGDINGDYRDSGIESACKDLGINLLSETRGISTTEDITKATESLIASYPEMDSIFIVGGTVTTGALAGVNQSLVNHNLADKVRICMVDIATGMLQYMDNGPLKLVAGGNLIADTMLSLVLAANALHGTPLGEKPEMTVPMFWITNSTDAGNYDTYIEGSIPPFSADYYKQNMFKWLNPQVTQESVQKIFTDYSIQSVMERNK
ncbi:MAG: substrate-binding domain-containing protein [Spirochaetaceae bacterium]|jgi:ABC-type sugar transport system substrate-binding protein|nr:substrate-binding domain-containing protein [Spirochaetaceae bacterium]